MLAAKQLRMQDDVTFYATAAQVIPLIFLTIVFEQRIWTSDRPFTYFGLQTRPKGNDDKLAFAVGLFIVLLIVNLFLGEMLALLAISNGPSTTADYFVTGAMALGGAVVVSAPLLLGLDAVVPETWLSESFDFGFGRIAIWFLTVAAALFTLVGVFVAIL